VNASTRVKVAIGIAAVIWFVVAILTHQTASTTALRTISIAGSAVTIIFLLYDRYLWRSPIVRTFTGKPLVAGTWRGTLQSDYVPPGKSRPVPTIPAVIRVEQTDSNLYVTLFTNESQSVSDLGRLVRESDGRWRITWQYISSPRPPVRHRSNVHQGVCDVYLTGVYGEGLAGQYFTNRKTGGEVHFGEWSKRQYSDAESALKGTDFTQAHPLARNPFSRQAKLVRGGKLSS
jgi:SMODS-associating 2TM, beta-strand rich effector domain